MRGTLLAIGIAIVIAMALTGTVHGAPSGGGGTAARNGQELLSALRDGDDLRATALIGPGTDVNVRDPNGATPLMWAVKSGSTDIVGRLLEAGAKPNLVCADGLGPLQIAIADHAGDAALLLLAKGASPNARRANGETALMTAARTGQLEVMRQLIAQGGNINAHEHRFDQTALMWSAGHPGQIKLLLEHGANVKARTKSVTITNTLYKSPAARGGELEDEGVYVSRQGGQSALFFAIQQNDLESVRRLIEAGASVNERAADGSTPLLRALHKWDTVPSESLGSPRAPAFAPNLEIANYLLDRGASATATNSVGYTPLHGAVLALIPETPSWVVPKYDLPLPHAKAPVDPNAGMALIKRLLDLGADPNAVTRYPLAGPVGLVWLDPVVRGSSPLHVAAYSHHTTVVGLLLDRGGDPNLMRPDGHTALSLATKANDLLAVKLLVAHGADLRRIYDPTDMINDFFKSAGQGTAISRSPRHHETLLHIAAVSGAADVVAFLVEQGVSPSAKNDRGETPLMMADTEEQRRYALETRETVTHSANPHAVRSTATSDAIRKAMGLEPIASPAGAPTS